jgi:EAL domain-containing protein (putative c-di-GMP-specific phosphodiesterase class I)
MEVGCDVGQGYLFAKPMTEQELMAMVMAGRT